MQTIPPLAHGSVTILLLQLGLLLLVARLLGHAANRVGLPAVLGELLAGIVLGPSILGAVAPGAFAALVPVDPARFHLLEVFAFLGVLLLLVVTGLETDIDLIVSKGRSAAAISLTGIVVPFSLGFLLGQLLPDAFVADPDQRLVFSLFLGVAMGISAIPVIAKVLMEMNAVKRDIGQLTLAAGMIDDTIGWILLSVVAGLARSGVVDVPSVISAVLSVIVVVGLSFTAGRRFVAWLFKVVDEREGGDLAKVSLLMVLALLFGSLTHALNIEAVLGAFIVGILAGQVKRFHRSARHVFETFTLGVFAPIFFATSGLRVDLRALLDPTVLAVGVLALLVAIVGKFAGAALGAKLSGLGKWEALSLGAGMNARGAIEIIVATIGLGLGVLTPEMYTIILLIAIVTSLMAPPILRATLRRVPMTAEEARRLDDASRRERSFIANLNRVLLPTRGGGNSVTAARLLSLALEGERAVEVTTMAVVGTAAPVGVRAGGPDGPASAETFEEEVATAERALDVVGAALGSVPASDRRRLVQRSTGSVVDTIREESRRGYDLLVLGATDEDRQDGTSLFGGLIDRLVQDATSPVFVVREQLAGSDGEEALNVRRILLPTAGTGSTRRPLEFATAIARACGARVDVLHVVEREPQAEPWLHSRAGGGAPGSHDEIAEELLESVAAEVRAAGVDVVTHLEWAARAEQGVVDVARRLEVDLVVLSSSVRPVTRRAFFGHRIDHVLAEADCTVLVVS
jgi:Kef-type K+ transport system membrane component KefB/nucleotide-binding universal stress UspA family protein